MAVGAVLVEAAVGSLEVGRLVVGVVVVVGGYGLVEVGGLV